MQKNYLKLLNNIGHSWSTSDSEMIMAVELENVVKRYGIYSIYNYGKGEEYIKSNLPNLSCFNEHMEWDLNNNEINRSRLKTAAYFYYVKKGFDNECFIDRNVGISKYIENNMCVPGSSFYDGLFEVYFIVFRKIMIYVNNLDILIDQLLLETMKDIRIAGSDGAIDCLVEHVFFLYGLYIEILEIYNPEKLKEPLFGKEDKKNDDIKEKTKKS